MKFYGVVNTDISGSIHLFSTLEKAKEYMGEGNYIEPEFESETFYPCEDEYWMVVIDSSKVDTD